MTTRKECKAFTIDRSKWKRNGADIRGGTSMLNAFGNRCCLGFYAEACGAIDEELAGAVTPAAVFSRAADVVPDWLLSSSKVNNSIVAAELMEANDNTGGRLYKPEEREAFIQETFARHGVEVTFVDGPAAAA